MRLISLFLIGLGVITTSCGTEQYDDPDTKIIGGTDAKRAYPFMVSLQGPFGNGIVEHLCGGVVISPNAILTAAHCVDTVPRRIVVGAQDLSSEADATIRTHDDVESIQLHPKHDGVNSGCDYAIITLKYALPPRITPIRLSTVLSKHLESAELKALGWGDKRGTGYVARLQEVSTRLISQDACKEFYSDFEIDDSMACTYSPGHDTCGRDAGGPVFLDEAEPTLVGITSWGIGCAATGKPRVVADVRHAVGWIFETVGETRMLKGTRTCYYKAFDGQIKGSSSEFSLKLSLLNTSAYATYPIGGHNAPFIGHFSRPQVTLQRNGRIWFDGVLFSGNNYGGHYFGPGASQIPKTAAFSS